MIPYHIHADLASERRKTLLAEAEAFRLAKQARSHRQPVGTSAGRRSLLRWIRGWSRPGLSQSQRVPTGHTGRAESRASGPEAGCRAGQGSAQIPGRDAA